MKTKTAAEQQVRSLYHYQAFDDPTRLAQILTTGSIYCSNPKAFNDPWDCRPYFSKMRLDDPVEYRRAVQWFVRVGRKHYPLLPETEHARREQILLVDRARLEWMINQMTASMEQAAFSQYRVYCLSTHAAAPLMWSHYAASHRGLCLEFSVRNVIFCGALPVEYLDNYPELDLSNDDEDASLKTLLTKSSDWCYENEFRLIVAAPGYASPGVLPTNDNFLTLPPGALRSVIMGCLMPEKDREIVGSLARNASRAVGLSEAHRVPNHYALDIRELS
jgi:Protein of unknown function (DUF2971)